LGRRRHRLAKFLNAHADACGDLAEVLQIAGKSDETAVWIDQSLTLYSQKGNIALSERARTKLAALREASPRE
jgi:hypothetical protein